MVKLYLGDLEYVTSRERLVHEWASDLSFALISILKFLLLSPLPQERTKGESKIIKLLIGCRSSMFEGMVCKNKIMVT